MSFVGGQRDLVGEVSEAGLSQFRRELVLQERASATRLRDAYNRLIAPTREAIQRVETMPAGQWRDAVIYDLRRLQDQMADSLADLEGLLRREGQDLSQSAAQLGMQYAEFAAGSPIGWNTPGARAVARLADYMDRPAMREALSQFGSYHAQQVADLALSGISAGWNPLRTAAVMRWYIDQMPIADAERLMRTVQNWSYRTASIEGWRANSSVVQGWWWRASLGDPRTCISCVSMHGSRHTLDETLDDHHRGRCVPIPILSQREGPGAGAGEAWFRQRTRRTQVQMMGRARWMAWTGGEFEFNRLSMTYQDAIYGQMRTETPLVDLVGADRARYWMAAAREERRAERLF